jgi:xyloglucan-specific endo-beta-1,4-glucanase
VYKRQLFNGTDTTKDWGAKWDVKSGNPNDVKAYPALVRGWHWGTWSPNSGLPRQASSLPYIDVDWWATRDWQSNSTFNMSLDLFCHDISNPTWQNNPTGEIMVWYDYNKNPVGSQVGTVNLGGENWEKWSGNVGWNVVSYRKVNRSWGRNDLPLRDFVTNAGIFNGKWLTSIQTGWESFEGGAQWRTTWFSISGL